MSQLGGMGATPARRSARLSQAGSVTNQSVITTMTTGGTRQRKKGPLTKVKARKSNAYGASGHVGAAEELSLSATGFAQAFQNQRGDAVERDDQDDDDIDELGAETPRMSGALNGGEALRSSSFRPEVPTPVAPGLSFQDSEEITPSDNDLAASVGDTSKSFGPVHEAGMLFPPLRREPSRQQPAARSRPLWQQNKDRRIQASANGHREEVVQVEVEAVREDHPVHAVPAVNGDLEKSIKDIVAEEQARLLREGPPEPLAKPRKQSARQQRNNPQVDEWLGTIEPEQDDEPDWPWRKVLMGLFWSLLVFAIASLFAQFMSQTPDSDFVSKPGMMTALSARVSRAWYDAADWVMPAETQYTTDSTSYDFSKGNDRNKKNTVWSEDSDNRLIRMLKMEDAITQLRKDLPDHIVVRRNPGGTLEITDEFWNALSSKAKSAENNAEWIEFLELNKDKLRAVLGVPRNARTSDPHPEALSQDEFLALIQDHYRKISAQVDEKVAKALKSQITQITAIAQKEAKKAITDSIRFHALAQSNLLTNYELNLRKANYFSLGLGAVVDPTLTSATFSDDSWANIGFKRWMLSRPHNPPTAALDSWAEPGDCWCAAPNPSTIGQAELTVSMPYPIYPQQVTIEHLPMTMMPTKKITNAPRTVELWVETAGSQDSHRGGACLEGPAGWTCLGSFRYNIHASNHQQTFDLDVPSTVPVTRAMLRVTSNWGADHTCLYRVRLHGRDAEEDYQYGVHLSDPVQ
ncbi:UNC-like C-terminal-domain-containing protein [Ampelomyces quisqualis]|uniref:UNC-like C-terminal-domain-containing protein n=1 Tax=Ampelomyces quisqualis TaxID=50730 RepID=A0A6A5QYQ3_AMPQU|nr:UNC-like C-terminal-domain-containing protein [Ampelomyces quisqualis]